MSWIRSLSQNPVDQTTTLRGVCVFKPDVHQVEVTIPTEGYNRWMGNGEFIQVALPDTTSDDREWLMSGICSVCWNDMMENDL